MAIALTLETHAWFHPGTKREVDILALKLFCLGVLILAGLITAGVL